MYAFNFTPTILRVKLKVYIVNFVPLLNFFNQFYVHVSYNIYKSFISIYYLRDIHIPTINISIRIQGKTFSNFKNHKTCKNQNETNNIQFDSTYLELSNPR